MGVDGIPVSVEQLTVAFDGWGGDVIDPWQFIGTGMMQSYLNLRLLHRDEQMNIVPLWATEWRQTNEGIHLTLNPKARWQDGTPATAEDVQANVEALMGKYAPEFKGTPRSGQFKRVVQEVQILGPHQVLIKTEMPDPSFFWLMSASSYHQVWFGPSAYIKKVDHEGYIQTPLGGGPYQIKTFKQGERIVWERWEDFWGDYPYWKKPQHRVMEWLQVPDDAARYALLRGKQVDMAVNIPYAIAKDLPRSESGTRGVNPNKGPIWTQTHLATGKMQITFDAVFIVQEKSPGWETLQNDPTLNPKVRQALELAIDKRALESSRPADPARSGTVSARCLPLPGSRCRCSGWGSCSFYCSRSTWDGYQVPEASIAGESKGSSCPPSPSAGCYRLRTYGSSVPACWMSWIRIMSKWRG